jgi:hypothetical protein
MNIPTVIFLDIDEVLSLADRNEPLARFSWWKPGLPAWPIPLAFPLLRALDQDRRLHPVWLTCWGRNALLWNERAGTRPFPVAYPLTRRRIGYARRWFPDVPVRSEKLLAARYYLRQRVAPVVWIEDGFCTATEVWAAQSPLVRLVNTTQEPLSSFLLTSHADSASAVKTFLSTYILQDR